MTRRPTVAIQTLGCKLNLADSELIARAFSRLGFQVVDSDQPDPVEAPDVFIVNTCTVTHVADRKARQQLRYARRRFPSAYVVATGCYPARAQAEVAAMPEVDLVAGNDAKPDLAQRVADAVGRGLVPRQDDLPPRAYVPQSATRAFVKIQEGCNDYCSYCIIPKTRGASRTFPVDVILAELHERERQGYQEAVLTGTQLGDYGIAVPGDRREGPDHRDQSTEGDPLADLLEQVLRQTRLPRVRLSSIQPQDITARLLALWQDPRLCPHFHLPLQSGSNKILRRMRRRYRAEDYLAAIDRIHVAVPDVSITTDVIAGFPGETDDDFEATLAVARGAGFADIHVFPYSDRPGTLAVKLDGRVPEPVKRERVARLLALAGVSREAHQSRYLGTTRPILWEDRKNGLWTGLTDNYLRVYSPDSSLCAGLIQALTLTTAGFAHGAQAPRLPLVSRSSHLVPHSP